MGQVYLHIGLHKTATKYYQHHVFPYLDEENFVYNPERLTQYLMDVLKADEMDQNKIIESFHKERDRILNEFSDKKILISREIMSGDLFSAYRYWEENVELLYQCFPNAKILISLRYQPSWLVSCYRESLHEHHYQSIDKFLNYNHRSKTFEKPDSKKNAEGYAQLYALNLDYGRMLDVLYQKFGKDNIHLWFFEKFKENRPKVTQVILEFLESGEVDPKPLQKIPNRGFSALAVHLSIIRAKVFKRLGLNSLVHRPIFFFGKSSIPAGNIETSILDKDKYWGPQFKRDNEEVRSPNYPNLTIGEKIRREFSWRHFIKERFDRVYYYDWDLLGALRSPLENKYNQINFKLTDHFEKQEIPDKYL